ncbi:MAG: AAA family ATPase, partial [Verrucomicrobia bacterium]|nr:AAA family ATPase [Verrucomicrobiota bacterium]
MQCPQCHHRNRDGAKFCTECGAKLGLSCAGCGALNDASARFCQQCGASLTSPSDSSATTFLKAQRARAAQESTPPHKEERRWVTVLFADLSGFTSLSEKMDPEDVKALAHVCAERMSAEVRRFGGTVISVAGDQIYAAFGAPISHEDDAERALRAALAIRDCQLSDNPALALQVHVGVNTGEVMAGLIGPEERRDYTLMGDTVNTAARLMSAAPSGSVLVGEETWRATRRIARYRDLPPISVKGKEHPVAIWEALGATAMSEARPLGATPLLGRDHELSLLSEIWLKVVREARPQLVTIIGEPGIGKSRIVAEFERQYCTGAIRLHGRCLPYGESLGYWALVSMLKEAAEITAEDDPVAALAKLETLVRTALGEAVSKSDAASDLVRHLALLVGLDRPVERDANVPDQKTLHGSVRRFCEALAGRQPLCLLFDDIHWADDALLDLIEHIASRA